MDLANTPWSLENLFDSQLQDAYNFGLSDNVINLITAVLTGLTILLVVDLCFRVIVRSLDSQASSHAVYRRWLLMRCSNPIEAVSSLTNKFVHGGAASTTARNRHRGGARCDFPPTFYPRDDWETRSRNAGFPLWKTVFIAGFGLLLIFIELLLIFLTTNRSTPVPIDRKQLPSFRFEDPGKKMEVTPVSQPCTIRPLCTKPGFISLAKLFLCAYSTNMQRNDATGLKHIFNVSISRSGSDIVLRTDFQGYYTAHQHYIGIGLENGTLFKSVPQIPPDQVQRVLPGVFARYRMKVRDIDREENRSVSLNNWTVHMVLDLTEAMAKRSETTDSPEEADDGPFFTLLVLSVMRGSLSLSGRSVASRGSVSEGAFLHYIAEPLIIIHRPWLSVTTCICLLLFCFNAWLLIVCVARWGSGVEDNYVWARVFNQDISDFNRRPEQTARFE